MELKELVGKKIKQIFMCEEAIRFVTDTGTLTYEVDGDCCSYSYMYDIYGVKNILGKVVTGVKEVTLKEGDRSYSENYDASEDVHLIRCYGFQIFANDEKFGDMTCVFSFRNSSNGYYGGWIKKNDAFESDKFIDVTGDIVDISKLTK